jgi:site-specific DNA-cytosine methylase
MFGQRLNSVDWQAQDSIAGLPVEVDDTLPPDVVEFRDTVTGEVLGRFSIAEVERRFMLSGGIAGDGEPRPVDAPAPTLGGKGTAVWVESEEQWIRAARLATGETPKGRALRPGEARTEIRRSGERIEEGFDPAAEPAATVTSLDQPTYCVFCRCSDDDHDADGACSGCQAGLIGGTLPHCTWEAHEAAAEALTRADGTLVDVNDQTGSGDTGAWSLDRPATTIATRDLVPNPGANANRFNDATKSRNDGVRVTVAEAAILQSFRPDYPWQGTKTRQYQQVGNAVPPRLAAHVLAETIGTTPPTYE